MTSYTNASSETGDGTLSSRDGKRNRKTQALSALLSATALGVFLEGCGGVANAGGGGGKRILQLPLDWVARAIRYWQGQVPTTSQALGTTIG